MTILTPDTAEFQVAAARLQLAARIAHHPKGCQRSSCGAIIISRAGENIGSGYNSPPNGDETQRRCLLAKADFSERFHSDCTCCVHAEQRAVIAALRENPHLVPGSTIYFARCNSIGELQLSHEPRCTICSKMVLDVGISTFVMWRADGITTYSAVEFNDLSFAY